FSSIFVNLEGDPRITGISEIQPPSPAPLFLSMKTTKHCLRVVNWRRGFHRNKRRRTLLLRIRTRRLERSRPLPSGIPKDAFGWPNRVQSADRRFSPQRRGRPRSYRIRCNKGPSISVATRDDWFSCPAQRKFRLRELESRRTCLLNNGRRVLPRE